VSTVSRRYPLRGLVDGARYRRMGVRGGTFGRNGLWWRVYALFACWQVLGYGNGIESAQHDSGCRRPIVA
jgi:hypothetical protein